MHVVLAASSFLYVVHVTAESTQISGWPENPLRKCGGIYRDAELSLFSEDVPLKNN